MTSITFVSTFSSIIIINVQGKSKHVKQTSSQAELVWSFSHSHLLLSPNFLSSDQICLFILYIRFTTLVTGSYYFSKSKQKYKFSNFIKNAISLQFYFYNLVQLLFKYHCSWPLINRKMGCVLTREKFRKKRSQVKPVLALIQAIKEW